MSVSRRWYVPPWLAKAYAKRWVQRPRSDPPKFYRGLAFVPVEAVRKAGSDIVDSRHEYLGHADIRNGVVREKHVALAPDVRKMLDDRLQKIAKAARYIEDENPDCIRWNQGG